MPLLGRRQPENELKLAAPVFALGAFTVGASGLIVVGLLSSLTIELDISEPEAVQLLTVFGLVYAACSPLFHAVTWRWDGRRLLALALLVVALGNVLAAVAPGFELLLLTRIVAAVGAALFTSVALPRRRGLFRGLGAAVVVGVPLGALLSEQFGYRTVLSLLAALALVSAVTAWTVLPAIAAPPRMRLAERIAVVRDGRILTLLVVTVVAAIAAFSVYALVMPVLAADAGVRGTAVVVPLFGYGLGGVAGRVLGERAVRRWGAKPVLPVALALLVVLPMMAHTRVAATVFVVLWGLCSWAVDPPIRRLFAELAPRRALYGSAVGLGIGLSGLLGGVVLYEYGPDALPEIAAVLAVFALVLVVVADFRREGRRGPGALPTGSQDTTGELSVGTGRTVGMDRGRVER